MYEGAQETLHQPRYIYNEQGFGRSDGGSRWHHALSHQLAVTTSTTVVVSSVLVPDLASALASPVLATLNEAGVPVCPDYAVVQLGSVDVAHGVLAVLSGVVFHEAETAGCFMEPI